MLVGVVVTAMGGLTAHNPDRWWIEFGVPTNFQSSPRTRRFAAVFQLCLGLLALIFAAQMLMAA